MKPQTAALPTETPQRIDQGWVIGMPKEIAELFGVPEGLPVTFLVQPGNITAVLNLALQTEEARNREPGWFFRMPDDLAESVGAAKGSLLALYAKLGEPYVEVIPPPTPEFHARIQRILERNREDFEELKRLGD